MQKISGQYLLDFSLLGICVLVDRFLKFLFLDILDIDKSMAILDSFLSFELVLNRGAIFGFNVDKLVLIIGTAVILLLLLLFYFKGGLRNNFLQRYGLVFVAAGAIGNLIDRVFLGYVIDWIQIGFWPAFNFADVLIVVGAVLVLVGVARVEKGK